MAFFCLFMSVATLLQSDTVGYRTNDQIELEQVVISAPAAHSEILHIEVLKTESLKQISLGQDLPQIISQSTSVVTTSDAGNNIGYAGMRIRGCDLGSVQVSLNGVPMNEQESQGVYFVDIPDLLNSLGKVEIIRGNGNLFNSSSSGFGGSMMLTTQKNKEQAYLSLSSSFGSFNTHKENLSWGTGLINKHFNLEGFFSNIGSDGYIDRAFSKLDSRYLQGSYVNNGLSMQLIYIGGSEKTYQAWYGLDKEIVQINRKYNPAGEIRQNGELIGFYNNQTDNYTQNYWQFITQWEWVGWNFKPTLYYKDGGGYYQNYNNDFQLNNNYGISLFSSVENDTSNTIDQKWMKTKLIGGMLKVDRVFNRFRVSTTIDANDYWGQNYGNLLWAENALLKEKSDQWYSNPARKKSGQIVLNVNYEINPELRLYTQLQYKYIRYSAKGNLENLRLVDWDETYHFVNPGISLAYTPSKKWLHSYSLAISHREPNRTTFEQAGNEGLPTYETLYDLEIGSKYKQLNYQVSLNAYGMFYNNQLVPNGKLNTVGAYISTNVKNSYRIGLEANWNWKPNPQWEYVANISLSRNRIKNYNFYVDNWDSGEQDQVFLKDTPISFSPDIVSSQLINYHLSKNMEWGWELKYVGSQYLDNTNNPDSRLKAYCINNIHAVYSIYPTWCQKISFSGVIQNLLNSKYESNGWTYQFSSNGERKSQIAYYPQAGINFLVGFKVSL